MCEREHWPTALFGFICRGPQSHYTKILKIVPLPKSVNKGENNSSINKAWR